MAAVAVPSVIGYLEDAKINTDNSNAKEIESAILRAIASNKLVLTASMDGATIYSKIQNEIQIPDVPEQGEDYSFYVNIETGRGQCAKTKPGDKWVTIP